MPDWYLNEPLSFPGDERYLDAFWYLATERRWASGPIPVTLVEQYAFRHGFPPDMIASFVRILRKLDEAWLGWVQDELKRQREAERSKRGVRGLFRRPRRK